MKSLLFKAHTIYKRTGNRMFVRTVGTYLLRCVASHSTRQYSSQPPHEKEQSQKNSSFACLTSFHLILQSSTKSFKQSPNYKRRVYVKTSSSVYICIHFITVYCKTFLKKKASLFHYCHFHSNAGGRNTAEVLIVHKTGGNELTLLSSLEQN